MKLTCFFLVLFLGLVTAELCGNDGRSCAHLQCSGTQVPVCISHVCTCDNAPTSGNDCVVIKNCEDNGYWDRHHCNDRDRHCIDGRCRCIHV